MHSINLSSISNKDDWMMDADFFSSSASACKLHWCQAKSIQRRSINRNDWGHLELGVRCVDNIVADAKRPRLLEERLQNSALPGRIGGQS